MAAESVGLIRSEQPHGPYRLIGYSFGGLLALESARVLGDAGEVVAFVGLVDSFFDQRYWPRGLFVAATVRRAAVHARGLLGQAPGRALRELVGRSVRLARRLRSRHQPSDVDTTSGPVSVQEANIAVMARWRPRVHDGPVTLFAATESDFGCDLADLWRPWLTRRLDVRRVWGDHLALTQTTAGQDRLAQGREPGAAGTTRAAPGCSWPPRSVGRALRGSPWISTRSGARSTASRRGAAPCMPSLRSSASYRLGLAEPVRSLRTAIEASDADVVVPFDDRTRHALALLHAGSDPRVESGARMRERLERSFGSPDKFSCLYSRAAVMALAAEHAVRCRTPLRRRLGRRCHRVEGGTRPAPAVLKTDGSWGGREIAI